MRRITAILIVLSLAFTFLQLDYSKVEGGSYEYYISHWQEVNIPNLVTAILADWRAYDTLGEATLLFTAVIGFYLLLGGKKK
ncbi:hydrogen gas-evolving membrane-bound hydrogenase subunit E [Thermococcus sp.]